LLVKSRTLGVEDEMVESIAYWRLGTRFLGLAQEACAELVAAGNANSVVWSAGDEPPSLEYVTRWSDFSVGVPVLFDFYHGIELLLKGFIAAAGGAPKGHKLAKLLVEFEAAYPATPLGTLIRIYTTNLDPGTPLGLFFKENSVTTDDWYQALKYPESTGGQAYDHSSLEYGGQDTVAFWSTLGEAAAALTREAVSLARSRGHA
jgi:hypothetical protein